MAASSTTGLTPVSECDYLEDDKPIRGQNYVCLSFISPEDVLARKDVFTFDRYIAAFSKEVNELFTNLRAKYPDDAGLIDTISENHSQLFKGGNDLQDHFKFFRETNNATIDKEFHELNNFATTIRGIKVRGTYDTFKEADVRAQVLKRSGDKFNIYVAQVGCWCPWSPNPDDITNQEYSQTALNTLMKKYNENMEIRDQVYEERKESKINKSRIATAADKAEMENSDAWLSRMRENLAKKQELQGAADAAAAETEGEPSGSLSSVVEATNTTVPDGPPPQ